MNTKSFDKFSEPDLKLVGLQIWIHGRQFPDSIDYWDNNWLNVTAYCGAEGSSVWVSGPIIHLSEISSWLDETIILNNTINGEANLNCIEPELSVSIKSKSHGQLDMEVNITPNHLYQSHKFIFKIDQSYLFGLISNCKEILIKYPITNSDNK